MAIYHLNARKGSRDAGKSALAKLQYVTRTGRYAGGAAEVAWSLSGNLPGWAAGPSAFWGAADAHERANGRLFREYEVSLPRELSEAAWQGLVRRFADEVCGGDRLPWTAAIHRGGGGNPHFHFVVNERADDGIERDAAGWFGQAARPGRDPAAGGARKTQRLEKKRFLYRLREAWAETANAALAEAGHAARIDHRTLAAQRDDALARGDREAAAELDREPVHQSRSSMALDDADPDGRPGTMPRRRRRRRRPAGTDAGRRAGEARRRNAGICREREELRRQAEAISAKAEELKRRARNAEADCGRAAEREAAQRELAASTGAFNRLEARLAQQGRRLAALNERRRLDAAGERLEREMAEFHWRGAPRRHFARLASRLEEQGRRLERERQEKLQCAAETARKAEELARWRERVLAELRRQGRYRGPADPSGLVIVSHPAFVAPAARKSGPEAGVIDRGAMDSEPPHLVGRFLRSLARVTEPLFTPPSERAERVLMRAVEDRRRSGRPIEKQGQPETLILVQEEWQIEPARAAAPGAAVWTMFDTEWKGSLLELASAADELVLPYSATDYRELQASDRRRARQAVSSGDHVEAIRDRINRAGLGKLYDMMRDWQTKGPPHRIVRKARNAVWASDEAIAAANAAGAAARRVDKLKTEEAGLSVIGRLRRGKALEDDIKAAAALLEAARKKESRAAAALKTEPTVTEEMRELARQSSREEIADFCKAAADAGRRTGVLGVAWGGAKDRLRIAGWDRNWKIARASKYGGPRIEAKGQDAAAAAAAHYAGAGCSVAFEKGVAASVELEPDEWLPASHLPAEPESEPAAEADHYRGLDF